MISRFLLNCVFVVVGGSFAAACGAGGTEPHPGSPAGALELTLEPGRAVTTRIAPTGGTIVVTGSDGTRYTLVIPVNALVDTTEITLTPVAQARLPMGGFSGAVQFAPEGLRLLSPATLTIKPASAVNAAELAGFGYHAADEGFHLEPAIVRGGMIEMPIVHFSGAGAARATPADIAAQLQRIPANGEDAYRQRIAGIMQQAQQTGAAPDIDAMSAVLHDYYRNILGPKLTAAAATGDVGAFQEGLAFARQLSLLGLESDPIIAEVFGLMKRALQKAYDDASVRCTQQHDLRKYTIMVSLLRLASLSGAENLLDVEKTHACLRFTVEITSTVTMTGGAVAYTTTNTAHVPISVLFGEVHSDTAAFDVSAYSFVAGSSQCTSKNVGLPAGGTFFVPALDFSFDADTTHAAPPLSNLVVYIDGQDASVTIQASCAPTPVRGQDLFWTVFRTVHVGERTPESPTKLRIGGWTITGGAEYARREYTQQTQLMTERTVFRLLHGATQP